VQITQISPKFFLAIILSFSLSAFAETINKSRPNHSSKSFHKKNQQSQSSSQVNQEKPVSEDASKLNIMRSYDDVTKTTIITDTLWNVIARQGKSKNYSDLLPLDGGTVGIAHFAAGGLEALYRHMDTKKYFNRSPEEMISKYSNNCRPPGKKGNDRGWGCYSKKWWYQGMKKFLESPESVQVQKQTFIDKTRPAIELALKNGWHNPKQIAIAIGISNSLGKHGFAKLASAHHWNSESTFKAYGKTSAHRQRRVLALNEYFQAEPDRYRKNELIQTASYLNQGLSTTDYSESSM
jgi:hypothetical protein